MPSSTNAMSSRLACSTDESIPLLITDDTVSNMAALGMESTGIGVPVLPMSSTYSSGMLSTKNSLRQIVVTFRTMIDMFRTRRINESPSFFLVFLLVSMLIIK
jgi:hypothetical protein